MTAKQFVTFQKFNDQIAALELATLLKQNNIEYLLEDYSPNFDVTFANNELTKEFRIKIQKHDFENVDSILQQISLEQIGTVDNDYYLFDFTDEELMEIISKKDEWGSFDFLLAQKLLKERGKEVTPEVVELLKKQRLSALTKPEQSQKSLIIAGYIMAFLGGLLGVFIGWHLLTHKKTLPNGERVFSYSQTDRKHGNRIVIIGGVCFILGSIIKIWNANFLQY
jgi:hypothetical protein